MPPVAARLKAKCSMNDLISRSALLKAFENNIDTDVCQEDADYQYLWGFSWETVESAIQAAPAVDAVEVVRCKDCKHYGLGACLKIYSDGAASVYAWQYRKPDDFCSYGERRADDADRTET